MSRRRILEGAGLGLAWATAEATPAFAEETGGRGHGSPPGQARPPRSASEGEVTTSDGAEIHYVDTGHPGPTILLVGGWTMSTPWWREQLEGLGDDFRVVAIDPRAYGASGKVDYGHRIARHAADVRDVIEALQLRKVTLVGWSLAANTVLAYYEQFGAARVDKAVYIEMSPYPNNRPQYPVPDPSWDLGYATVEQEQAFLDSWRADPPKVASDLVSAMFAMPVRPSQRDWMVREILKTPVPAAAAIEWDTFHSDWRSMVPAVDIPVLVANGRQSTIYPTAVGQWMVEHLPRARWHVFDQSGHCPFLEEAREFNRTLAEFAAA